MIKPIATYTNGNYNVKIYSDGTKIRYSKEDYFIPEFPETIDVNISNYCETGCSFCYLGASKTGRMGNLDLLMDMVIDPYTELALNFNSTLPENIYEFLLDMRSKKCICNVTVNYKNLNDEMRDILLECQESKLIHGIGISLPPDITKVDKSKFSGLNNIIFHVINGIHPVSLVTTVASQFFVLVLGYKEGLGRAQKKVNYWREDDVKLLLGSNFTCLSFDNLAISQLNIQSLVSPDVFQKHYMGNDGKFSFYIDLVGETYSVSSTTQEKFQINSRHSRDLFKHIRSL